MVSERPLDRYALAHDASHYLLVPQAVVTPRDTAQVAALLRACDRVGASLTFRGAGTSLSGQAVTDALLVDTRAAFQAVTVLDGGRRVRVQPGATVRAVNARLAAYGRKLGPDPASEGACTLGGVIANNSSGMQCGTRFNAYRTLESLVLVLPSGTVVDSSAPEASRAFAAAEPDLHEGLLRLRRRILDDPASVATIERQFAIKNTMGYGLNSFLDHEDPLDILVHLMVGSEGTLGFVAEATFTTLEVLPDVATGLLVFDDLAAAAAAVPDLVAADVATAELLDAASLRVSQQDPACPTEIGRLDVRRHAALLVELQAATAGELGTLRARAAPLFDGLPLASAAEFTADPAARASLWATRKGLYSAVAGARSSGTSALLEDVAVPVARLGEMSGELTGLFAEHGYDDPVMFGHARDGNLHFMLEERFGSAASLRRYEAFTEDMVDLVLGLGGTLKAEHGTGRIMAPFVRRQYGDELYEVMSELKRMVDPRGLLNPGSVLSDDPRSYLRDLKTAPPVEEEVDRCVECGFCEPVCPSRALTLTPRQRIVLRREIAAAEAAGDAALATSLRRDYEYDGVDTCAADGMCRTACPVRIDTGDLVRRLRAESASRPAESVWASAARHWGTTSRGGGLALTVAGRLPSGLPRGVTRLARRLAGADTVPLYDGDLPRGGLPRPRLEPPVADAVLFAACIGTMFGGSDAAGALVRLCMRAGVTLRTPAGLEELCCGTPWKSKGHRRGHAVMRERVLPALQEATEGGRLPVVVEASSCTEGLTGLLAGSGITVVDAVDFVAERILGSLTPRHPVGSVVVHPTCSTTALGGTASLVALARFVSADVTVPVSWGCCGFAGDRGLLHPELTASATAPEAAEVAGLAARATGADGGRDATAYVSSNRTCEIGMSRATGKPYRHVLDLLDEATSP